MTLEQALNLASNKIGEACAKTGANPARVAKILLMRHLGVSLERLFLDMQKELKGESEYLASVSRFEAYEPLEYITGEAGFYGLNFSVKKGVLIPRPETEILVDRSLEILRKFSAPKICEIGTGSGIISICLALNSNAIITTTDISEAALDTARENAEKFGVKERINFVRCAYMDEVCGEFDLLVSNPPYIARGCELDPFVLNEPREALFGGEAGDEILKNIVLLARNRNVKYLACEMGYDQRESMASALKFNRFEAEFYQDLARFDRGFTARNLFA